MQRFIFSVNIAVSGCKGSNNIVLKMSDNESSHNERNFDRNHDRSPSERNARGRHVLIFAIDNIKDLNLIYFNLFVMPGKRTSFLHVCNQDFHNI